MLGIDILLGGTSGFHKVASQLECQVDYFGTNQEIVLMSADVISSYQQL
jgi:hypothetical protein